MSLYFRKGLCPLLLPSEPPTPVPGTSLAARGRGRPRFLEPSWDRGLGRLPALSEAPPLSGPPSPSLPRPEPPSDLKTPSLHTNPEPPRSQAPKAPRPRPPRFSSALPIVLAPGAGAGRAGVCVQGAGARPLPTGLWATLANPERCWPFEGGHRGGAVPREGPQLGRGLGNRQISLPRAGERLVGRSHEKPPCAVPPIPLLSLFPLQTPQWVLGTPGSMRPPTTSRLDSAAKLTPSLGKPAGSIWRSGSGAGPRVGAPALHFSTARPHNSPEPLCSSVQWAGSRTHRLDCAVDPTAPAQHRLVQTQAAASQPRNWAGPHPWALVSSSIKWGL